MSEENKVEAIKEEIRNLLGFSNLDGFIIVGFNGDITRSVNNVKDPLKVYGTLDFMKRKMFCDMMDRDWKSRGKDETKVTPEPLKILIAEAVKKGMEENNE